MRTRVLTLPARLDAVAIQALAAAILAKRGHPLDLRAKEVQRVGTVALQVLLSTAATWRLDGCRLRLIDPSRALNEALATLGIPANALTAEGPSA